jgi:hypothetical protein
MARRGRIQRALLIGFSILVAALGVAASALAVEVPRPERVVTRESPSERAWRACRAYGERVLPAVELDVPASQADAALAGAAVLFALRMREQQLAAFTATCVRAAGFADAGASAGDATITR